MMDDTTVGFCIEVGTTPVCKSPVFTEFEDETNLIILILQYLKTYLPALLLKKKDCNGRFIKIDPGSIGIYLKKDPGDYIVLLVPTDDNSGYEDDGYRFEITKNAFELQLVARDPDFEGALENLIKLKSVIKTMLVNMGNNLGLNVEIDGFSFGGFSADNQNKIARDGTYRFSILDRKYRNV